MMHWLLLQFRVDLYSLLLVQGRCFQRIGFALCADIFRACLIWPLCYKVSQLFPVRQATLPCGSSPPLLSVVSFLCGTALLSLHICHEARFIKEGTRRLPTLCRFLSAVWFCRGCARQTSPIQNRWFYQVYAAICGEKREPAIVASWPCWSPLQQPLPEGVELGCGGAGSALFYPSTTTTTTSQIICSHTNTHTLAGHFPLCCCAPEPACSCFQIERLRVCVPQTIYSFSQAGLLRWLLQSLHDSQTTDCGSGGQTLTGGPQWQRAAAD